MIHRGRLVPASLHLQAFLKTQTSSYLYAILAVIAWSSVSTAFKIGLKHLTPAGLLLVSSFVATVLLFGNLVWNDHDALQKFASNLKQSFFAGLINPFAYYLILLNAYSRLRTQEAQALNYTWAIVLSILSVLMLKQRLRIRDAVALSISFVGVLVISTKGALNDIRFEDPIGTTLALCSSLFWAAYWIINLKDSRNSSTKLAYNFFVGLLLILVYVVTLGIPIFTPNGLFIHGILSAIYVGIFEMGLTFILWLKAIENADRTASVSNLVFLTPFISLVFINFILKERIHPATLIGLCMIVGSNILQKVPFSSIKNR